MAGLISIIMPAYNAEKYISKAIKSVLSQSYENWELLVIDDNSNDNTVNVVKAYLHDRRIKLFINMKNKGAAETRNTGLDNAIGKYICFLDADDYWDKDKLSSQYIFMEQNN
ncbi:glycosyltransferase family 2 protein, partial [Rodentibacter trehalosifermentans]|uniref:glycosyltransferase family 2 protein n=1 Tax=Rodentibacter trehalosifermentans TaxID=1908263 RepID=UPI00117A3245